jgi:ubiquinone/menaquinone biosynthesis C-methylase UbiE
MSKQANIDERFFPERAAGGFTRVDGTVQFYTRVNALIEPEMTVVDLGAGRGAISEADAKIHRTLGDLRGKARNVIGIDVDRAVLDNPIVDEALVYDGRVMPLKDQSVDLILADNILEHIQDPTIFANEIHRVLKPDGWFCARTPHLYSALVLAASVVPNRQHVSLLRYAQATRQAKDTFPTAYKLNSKKALNRHFSSQTWDKHSFTWSPEPAYHFNSSIIYGIFLLYQYIKQPFCGGEVLMIFMRKKAG